MKKLSFEEGLESFMINDDKDRVVRFNPADPAILSRLVDLQRDFTDYHIGENIELNPDGTPKSELEQEAAAITAFSDAMREAINRTFNADVYDTIFNGQSPLCIVGPRKKEGYLFEAVLDALIEAMAPAIAEYNKKNEGHMKKYLGDLE